MQQRTSSDYQKFLTPANFDLAWKRLLTSGDAGYKWYWRRDAAVVAPIRSVWRSKILRELKNQNYVPNNVQIVGQPKSTGLMRHRSVMGVGDLIVYQMIANIIANKMRPRLEPKFGASMFSNMPATKNSLFFLSVGKKDTPNTIRHNGTFSALDTAGSDLWTLLRTTTL